jgi:hypothetical protein
MSTSHTRKVVAGVVAGTIIAPIAAPALLGTVGFGSAGVGASMFPVVYNNEEKTHLRRDLVTWAAAWQSFIGNVAAGSIFAICQSVGAGGALPLAGYATGAWIGGAAAAKL